MDKSCQSSGESSITTTTTSSNNSSGSRDQYLKHLNKLSHKISKPIPKKPPTFDRPPIPNHQNHSFNPQPQPQTQNLQAQPQHQPPVYNINKNDFRDVVQKLTGSPAHERFPSSSSSSASTSSATPPPPPIHHHPRPAGSRLQKMRPPPLAQISNRPPPLLNGAVQPPLQPASAFGGVGRPTAPLSPLPPLPAVHAAAESPVSAHMRYLQNLMSAAVESNNQKHASGFSPLAPLVSPRWSNLAPPPPQQQGILPPPPATAMMPPPPPPFFQVPPSPPIPFGCLNSPRSPYPLLSPSLLLSPSSGQLGFPQLPLSPTVPVPSPRWRGF
ncbi:hypothetical protein TIFTF001_014562 [Ficus carica]|uniref:VQ domain-containing protein n=1 Tax=Ficus carica TaxID=3494 RepID=A0AA88DIH0_FICCA|nr:hypothetical protein TIFTF001_014562 [Ficus carica]